MLPKSEGIDILASGLLAATLVVIPMFLIGLLIYTRRSKNQTDPLLLRRDRGERPDPELLVFPRAVAGCAACMRIPDAVR